MTLLDKLIAIRTKDKPLFDLVRNLAHAEDYSMTMDQLEKVLTGSVPEPTLDRAKELFAKIPKTGVLRQLFLQPPLLSKADPLELLTFAEFSDLSPDSEHMFRTNDAVFMRLVDLSKQGPVSFTKIIQDDFSQLAILEIYFPNLAEGVRRLAQSGGWMTNMAGVERKLLGQPGVGLSVEAEALVQQVQAVPVNSNQLQAQTIILTPPRFSAMLAEEVLAYGKIHPSLPSADELIDRNFTRDPSPSERGRILAKRAFEQLPAGDKAIIEKKIRLRLRAIDELVRFRIFVKKDALEHFWPDLYDRLRRDYAGFTHFEKQIQQPLPATEEEVQRLKPYLEDERLVRLLKAQPHFGNSVDVAPSASVRPADDNNISVAHDPFGLAGTAPSSASSILTMESPRVEYEDVYIRVYPLGELAGHYKVELQIGTQKVSEEPVELDWVGIRERVRRLEFFRNVPVIGATRDISANRSVVDFTSQLKELGLLVYDQLFKGKLRQTFLKTLGSSQNLRIHWEGDPENPSTATLPWECLYVPPAPVSFLGLTRKYSLTRRNPDVESIPMRPIVGALRILFVSAEPKGVAPLLSIEQEKGILSTLVATSRGKAEIEVITQATIENVTQTLREFRPHLFHFSGHGVFHEQSEKGMLIFEGPNRIPMLISADQLAILLYDYDVFLTVLNGCDTGVSSTNDAVSSVAGALVKAGVPAVLATMREVQDEAAALFTREFYRSFLAGFTLEGSIAEARKALSLDYWDWSTYALFVGSVDLDSLRIVNPIRADRAIQSTLS